MADSTPLLPPYNPRGREECIDGRAKKATPSLDDTIESCIGGTGVTQILQAFLVAFAWFFDAQQTFINVFADAEPSWHCTGTAHASCASVSSPCGLPAGSWAWDRPSHSSVLSDWDLLCSVPAVAGLPASAFFAGCVVGGFLLATLADSSLGRKKMLLFSFLTMSITAALAAVSPNIWVYSASRFTCGFGRATVGTTALVLSTEMVAKRWRAKISTINFLSFTLGFLSLPAMAYMNRGSSWRVLYLWTSIPSFCYSICIFFLVPESPRWLLVRGRREEAIQVLKSIALSTGIPVMPSFSSLAVVEEEESAGLFAATKSLWEKRWAFRRLLAIMTVGFGVGMVYYGMPLGVGSLGPNVYVSVALNALAELPASLITFFLMGRLDRRSSVVAFTTAGGGCSVLCIFLRGKSARMAAEVVSFFSVCTSFNVLLVYSVELFPTCVRNSAIAMVRQALMFGGVWAPVLVGTGRGDGAVPFGVFGLVIGCCGLFAVGLPETRGRGISDTMEEEEYKDRTARLTGP